jgi:hypothetical protein
MRYLLAIMFAIMFFPFNALSASFPPFDSVTISGEVNTKYSKVGLFESGSSAEPYKSEEVLNNNGQYSISIDIPSDMRKKSNYYSADMRFWGDTNNNGIKDKGEPRSACHFIMWGPSAKQVSLQVYKGKKYTINSPYFNYDYK